MSSDRTLPKDPLSTDFPYGIPGYMSILEEYDDQPDQCTIFPTDRSDVDRTTTWITAEEGSYVAIRDSR